MKTNLTLQAPHISQHLSDQLSNSELLGENQEPGTEVSCPFGADQASFPIYQAMKSKQQYDGFLVKARKQVCFL